jgi:hypothetical protein
LFWCTGYQIEKNNEENNREKIEDQFRHLMREKKGNKLLIIFVFAPNKQQLGWLFFLSF